MAEPPTTATLVRRAAVHRSDAFARLHERLGPALWLWANLHVLPPLRRRLLPEDLVQEVWARAYAAFETYEPGRAGFRGWIYGIAYNVLREQLRAFGQQRRLTVPLADETGGTTGLQEPQELVDLRTSVVKACTRAEANAVLLDAIARLPAIDRKVIAWRGLEELPYAEVGARLGITADAADSRFRRAVERLRALLPPELAASFE